jgi:CheY-like chemotaxis protein
VPLVGLAADWTLLGHWYRHCLRQCDLVLTDPAGVETLGREVSVRSERPGDLTSPTKDVHEVLADVLEVTQALSHLPRHDSAPGRSRATNPWPWAARREISSAVADLENQTTTVTEDAVKLKALQAFALAHLGRTSEALQQFDKLLARGHTSADSLRLLLECYGYEVAVAYSGHDGVRAAERCQPDVVLCDIGLPGLDGYGVARKLRGNRATATARLIAVTAYGQDEDRRRSHEAGFEQHLVKPVDPDALQRVLTFSGHPETRGSHEATLTRKAHKMSDRSG